MATAKPAADSSKTVGVLIALLLTFASAAIPAAADTQAERASSALATTAPSSSGLVPLDIAPASHQASYDRTKSFGKFIDADRNCRDTRAEVLIKLSQRPVAYTDAKKCVVKTGRWTDPWSGVVTTRAGDFDVDHTVPLANAWRSGAWNWDQTKRVAFANELSDVDHLVPITKSSNRSKGDKGPERWAQIQPSAECRYALAWGRIKAKWDLTATADEWDALVDLASAC